MEKMRQKDIKKINAVDITASERIPNLRIIAISVGVYGRNGALLTDNDGNLYKITCRASSLFLYS